MSFKQIDFILISTEKVKKPYQNQMFQTLQMKKGVGVMLTKSKNEKIINYLFSTSF